MALPARKYRVLSSVPESYSWEWFGHAKCGDIRITTGITTAPELMTLPIDDHAIVRGHAVFDTCTLACGRMYRLTIHLQRFLQSARAARIPLPYGDDDEANRQRCLNEVVKVRQMIRMQTAGTSRRTRDTVEARKKAMQAVTFENGEQWEDRNEPAYQGKSDG